MTRVLLALAAVGLLAGCGSPPPIRHPELSVELPEQFGEDDSTHAPASTDRPILWWTSFEDERLPQLVEEAMLHNYDLAAAIARVDAAAAEARIAGAEIFPWAGASGFGQRQQTVNFLFPGQGDAPSTLRFTSWGVSLDISWELDVWGRLRNQRSAAGADFQAAAADLAAAQLSLAAQTLKGWFAALEARRQMELAQDAVESFDRTVEGIRARYRQGVRSSLDVRLAMVDAANARIAYENWRLAYDRSQRQLELLLGRYPEGALEVDGRLAPPPPGVPAGLPAELIGRRPDIAAAERRLAAANRRVAESKANLLPRISLTGSGGRTSAELEDLTDGNFSVWNIAGNLLQPIFQGGRLRAQVDRSKSLEEQALAQYANTVLTACGEVEFALVAERILLEEERAATVAAEQSKAAHELATYRYQNGLIDIITLLEAQRSAVIAESRHIDVRRRRLDTRVDLHLSLGGGFQDATVTPAEETPPEDAP